MNIAITLSLFLLITSPYEACNKKQFSEIPGILAKLRNKSADNEEVENEAKAVIKSFQVQEEDSHNSLKLINYINVIKILIVFLMTQLSGVNILTSYMVDIFSSVQIEEFTLVLITGMAEMVFSFLQMIIADKLGRCINLCWYTYNQFQFFWFCEILFLSNQF